MMLVSGISKNFPRKKCSQYVRGTVAGLDTESAADCLGAVGGNNKVILEVDISFQCALSSC